MSGTSSVGLSAGLGVTQAAVGLSSSIVQAQAARAQASFDKKIANINANFKQQEAQHIIDAGDRAAQTHLEQVAQRAGDARAAFAAQGVDVSVGSPLAVVQQIQQIGGTEAARIRMNAVREAWGVEFDAFSLRQQGRLGQRGAAFRGRQTIATSAVRFAGASGRLGGVIAADKFFESGDETL